MSKEDMSAGEALRRTMFEFDLQGAELSRKTGISRTQISRFIRNGADMGISNVQKIVDALPEDAKKHYLDQVFSVSIRR